MSSRSHTELSADSFLVASGSSLYLLSQQPPPPAASAAEPPPQFRELLVAHSAPITTACWNRNNKVVASGSADGAVQLLYSSGQVMMVLPHGDGGGGAGPSCAITSLSWSSGSKRLAAGSADGTVYIHDMTKKLPTAQLGGHLGGVAALEFQHEDALLAVASGDGSVVLYADPLRGGAPAPMPLPPTARDASPRTCLSLAAGEPVLAAGSAAGGVAVWDLPSGRVVEEYGGQHGGAAVAALRFAPLRPGWLWSAGGDGRVCLQDRLMGRSAAAALALAVGAPATCLTVKEDHSVLGVGTADGLVLLFDPRHTAQPLHTRYCAGRQPVSALDWQHRYPSLASGKLRSSSTTSSVVAAAAPAAAAGPSRLGPHSAAAAAPPPPPTEVQFAGSRSSNSSSLESQQQQQQQSPAAALQLLAISPLPSAAPASSRWQQQQQEALVAAAAAAAAEATPVRHRGADAPLMGGSQRQQEQHSQQLGMTPLAPPPPLDLSITPLVPLPAARPHAGVATAGAAAAPTPAAAPQLSISPLALAGADGSAEVTAGWGSVAGGSGGGGSSISSGGGTRPPRQQQLCISPLPGGNAAAQALPSPTGHRSPLGERTYGSGGGDTWSRGGLPHLASPLPSPTDAAAAAAAAAAATEHKAKMAAAAEAEPLTAAASQGAYPATSTGGQAPWSIGTAPQLQQQGTAAAAATAQHQQRPTGSSSGGLGGSGNPLEFSFAAAQRSLHQLAGGGGAAAAVAAAAGGGGVGADSSVLALHLDMLQQFQAQQQFFEQHLAAVNQQNVELRGEVAALRKQLASLAGRRSDFLWL